MFGSTTTTLSTHNPNKDAEAQPALPDGISCLAWSPAARPNFLCVGCWDKKARIWQAAPCGAAGATLQPIAEMAMEQPVLSTTYTTDGGHCFVGAFDGTVKMWDLASNQQNIVAKHGAGVKTLHFLPEASNMLMTGSYDKTLKFWDCRSDQPMLTCQLSERVYAADAAGMISVVATADKRIYMYDLRNPAQPVKNVESPLAYQSRCLALFHNRTGYALGSIEGRVAIQNFEGPESNSFKFKCHREEVKQGHQTVTNIYAVNAISFHPGYGTFATAGSDGKFNFWDKENRQRLKDFAKASDSISAGCFNHDGTLYGYSVSYDWHKGADAYQPGPNKNHVLVHVVQQSEIEPKPKTAKKK